MIRKTYLLEIFELLILSQAFGLIHTAVDPNGGEVLVGE